MARHGKTTYNALGLSNDDPKRDVRLTEKGDAQARALARWLRNIRFDCIYVSELPRTRKTADIIHRHNGAPIIEDSRTNDRKTGFDGKRSPLFEQAMREDSLTAKANDEESFLEENARVLSFLDDLRRKPHEKVIVETHSEIMKIVNGVLSGLSDLEAQGSSFDNAALFRFEI